MIAPFSSELREVRLLTRGSRRIAIYGDGSFSCEALAGAWAAYAPALGLKLTGVGRGSSIEQFELMALLEGVRAVLAIDHTSRPLHLHSDSDTALATVRCLSTGSKLPLRKRFDSVRELCACSGNVIGVRSLHLRKARAGSPFHRVCDRAARRAMQEHVRNLLSIDSEVRLTYEEFRRRQWLLEIEKLQHRIRRVQDELEACNSRIAQIRSQ